MDVRPGSRVRKRHRHRASPVGVDAPGGGHRRGQPGGPGGQRLDPLVQEADLVQQQAGELAVVVIEHAIQRLGQLQVLAVVVALVT